MSRVVITRNDAGHNTFNISEVLGSGAAAGISNLYYPQPERTFSNTQADGAPASVSMPETFLIHEFWPDIKPRHLPRQAAELLTAQTAPSSHQKTDVDGHG